MKKSKSNSSKSKNGSIAKKVMHPSAKRTRDGAHPSRASKKSNMQFIESVHKYIEDGKEYLSATTLIHLFQAPVDWKEQCRKKAIKLGMTFEELWQQWEDKRVSSAERGTRFHKKKEDQLFADGQIIIENTLCPVQMVPTINDTKEDNSMKLEDNTTYTEKMIWSKKYGICGTADLVQVVNGKIHIKDYKTNDNLKTSSYKDPKTGKTTRMLYPLQSLDDCNFNHYQIQLNLYMYMLLQQNRHLKMGEMTILHVHLDELENEKGMFPFLVKNLQAEIKQMLDHYLKTKNQ